MPRTARHLSPTGCYHIIMRGVNRQDIFEDEHDRIHFLELLEKYSLENHCKVNAYALMNNHVHLLILFEFSQQDQLELTMKGLNGSYASYFNKRHDRAGHLFQNRFTSVSILNQEQYMTVFKYISQNPMKAGLESKPGVFYRWSSAYVIRHNMRSRIDPGGLTDHEINIPRKELLEWLDSVSAADEAKVKAMLGKKTDDDARLKLSILTGGLSISEFQNLSRDTKHFYFRQLYNEGVSIRQINRITGSSRRTIERAVMPLAH